MWFSGVHSRLVKLWLLLLFAHRYPVEGIVVETKPELRQMVVAHKPIENYMPAMAMPFQVGREVDLAKLTPGTRVTFELKVGKHASLAENVRVVGSSNELMAQSPTKVAIGN